LPIGVVAEIGKGQDDDRQPRRRAEGPSLRLIQSVEDHPGLARRGFGIVSRHRHDETITAAGNRRNAAFASPLVEEPAQRRDLHVQIGVFDYC
jgi:hypothetical protein